MGRKEVVAAGCVVLVVGLIGIAAATLWPLEFCWRPLDTIARASSIGSWPNSILDFPRNILLFVPFGCGLAVILTNCGVSGRGSILIAAMAGFLASACVESCQLFLPQRTANLSDVIANTIGGVAGAGCWWLWCCRGKVARTLRPHHAAVALGIYLVFLMLAAWALMRGLRPGEWDEDYKLALGNEITQDRPWEGRIHNLLILDRAVKPAEAARLLETKLPRSLENTVVAAYALDKPCGLEERNQRLPDLVSSSGRSAEIGAQGVVLRKAAWLASESSVTSLSRRINQSQQFTVALTVATSDLAQEGPARIMTVSKDPFHRNLTVGQVGGYLVLRWRSFLTGKNGASPELFFPADFHVDEPKRIVITCNGAEVNLYTTGPVPNDCLFLGPEAGLGSILRNQHSWAVKRGQFDLWQYSVVFLLMTYVPLGALFGMASIGLRTREVLRIRRAGLGLFGPAVAIEALVAFCGDHALRWGMMALGSATTAVGYVAIRWWLQQRRFQWGQTA